MQETPVTTVAGESVTLGCELYGYAGGAQEIEWMTNNERIANDSEFTITVVEGSLTLQNGGDTPGPSMVSLLTISNPTTSHAGSFICTVNLGGDSEIKTLTLNVMDSPSPPTGKHSFQKVISLVMLCAQNCPPRGCLLFI